MGNTSQESPTSEPSSGRSPRPRSNTARTLSARASIDSIAAGAVSIFAVVVVTWFIALYTTIGPIDELQHIDYAEKISRADFVEVGDKFGEVAMREQACRGIDSPGFVSPSCDAATLEPEQFQEAGFNTAAGHPPTYYLVTGVAARAITILPWVGSFAAGARAANALWLAAGLLLTWGLLRELQVENTLTKAAVCLIVLSLPTVFYMGATVNNDGAAVVAGAGLTLVVLRYQRGATSLTALTIATMLVQSIKFTFVPLVVTLGGWLLLEALDRPAGSQERRRAALGFATMAISCAAVIAVWQVVVMTTAVVASADIPMTQRFMVETISFDDVLRQSLSAFPPTQNPYLPAIFAIPLVGTWVTLSGFLVTRGSVRCRFIVDHASRLPSPRDPQPCQDAQCRNVLRCPVLCPARRLH